MSASCASIFAFLPWMSPAAAGAARQRIASSVRSALRPIGGVFAARARLPPPVQCLQRLARRFGATARPASGSPRPRPCRCDGRTRARAAPAARGRAPRRARAAAAPPPRASRARRRPPPARAGTAARRNSTRHDGEQRREDEREVQARTAAPAVPYRSARRRSSRASGQSAITEPSTNTKPASQIRLTAGFTSTLK